jgi:hypothetical protein
MSAEPERGITQRVGERPGADPGRLKQARPRDLVVRFAAGALTSVCAALITLGFGARVGGVFLAFPAILAASLTLIEHDEDSAEAREDARGAVLGGCALAAFAGVAAVALPALPGSAALALAALAWVVIAVAGYWLLWR